MEFLSTATVGNVTVTVKYIHSLEKLMHMFLWASTTFVQIKNAPGGKNRPAPGVTWFTKAK